MYSLFRYTISPSLTLSLSPSIPQVGMNYSEVPIVPGESFCDRSVLGTSTVCIPDTKKHPDYCNSRFVVSEPYISFYYSIGLVLDQEVETVREGEGERSNPLQKVGVPVGVLCAIDTKPRELREDQKDMLDLIAKDIVRQLQVNIPPFFLFSFFFFF
jgi:hypothetical protein